MVYGLLIIGIIISIYGWRQIKNEEGEKTEENIDYNTRSQLDTIEDKLDILLRGGIYNQYSEKLPDYKGNQYNDTNYTEIANKIKTMSAENKSIEEMALALNIGKGEVLLLKRLLVR